MKWLILFVAPLCFGAELQLSLKRAVEIAVSGEGNTAVQLSGEAVKQAQARSAQARAALLPDLAASRRTNRTVNLAAMGIGVGPIFPGIQIPTFVGPFTTMDARVTASQTVFDFSVDSALPGVEGGRRRRRNRTSAEREEQVAAQVARAYLAAVRADADVEAAQANVALVGGGVEAGGEPEGGGHRHGHRDHARARCNWPTTGSACWWRRTRGARRICSLLRAIGTAAGQRSAADGQAASTCRWMR